MQVSFELTAPVAGTEARRRRRARAGARRWRKKAGAVKGKQRRRVYIGAARWWWCIDVKSDLLLLEVEGEEEKYTWWEREGMD